jgi:tetratricopeptide (TPR) repeat protein
MYYYEKSYRIYNSQSEKDYQALFEVSFNRASLHLNIGQFQEAFEKYKEIELLLEKEGSLAGESTLLELYRCKSLCCFKIEEIDMGL